jgi:hypothetical protein
MFHCNNATSWQAAGSIPNEVIEFFLIYLILNSLTMALRLTQPVTEMITRNLPGG